MKMHVSLALTRPTKDVRKVLDDVKIIPGQITDEHSQSSHGIPVVISCGKAYSPKELENLKIEDYTFERILTEESEHASEEEFEHSKEEREIIRAAREAGYNINPR